jgi:sugar transferase (PEP-CTERM/EpsH1 system associated)
MRILFLTPQLPYPPEQGTTIRNYHLMRGLADRHDLSLLTFAEPDQDLTATDTLRSFCRQIEVVPAPQRRLADRLRGLLLSRWPDMALRLTSPAFARRLSGWLSERCFDVVQIEGIEMARYLEAAASAPDHPCIVYDDHNAEYVLQERAFRSDILRPARLHAALYSFIQWRRLRRYEAEVCRRADRVVTCSAADAAALRRIAPEVQVAVVPNGVDTVTFQPQDAAPVASMVFTGKMDFRPNVDAALWLTDDILLRVRRAQPDATLALVGQRPGAAVARLAGRSGVLVTGRVADVRPYIAGAQVYVAPLRMGSGTRLKLLEAMAMGAAIVATRLGAEGLPVESGRHLLLADNAAEFARAVISLMNDAERRAALGREARRLVEGEFDWRRIVPRLERVYGP